MLQQIIIHYLIYNLSMGCLREVKVLAVKLVVLVAYER